MSLCAVCAYVLSSVHCDVLSCLHDGFNLLIYLLTVSSFSKRLLLSAVSFSCKRLQVLLLCTSSAVGDWKKYKIKLYILFKRINMKCVPVCVIPVVSLLLFSVPGSSVIVLIVFTCINYFQLIYVAHLSPTDWPAICAKIVLFFSLSSCVMFAQALPNLSFTSSCLPSLLFPVGFCLFYIIQTAVKTFHVILSLLHCAYESPANVNPKFAVAFLVVHLCKSSTKNSTRPV